MSPIKERNEGAEGEAPDDLSFRDFIIAVNYVSFVAILCWVLSLYFVGGGSQSFNMQQGGVLIWWASLVIWSVLTLGTLVYALLRKKLSVAEKSAILPTGLMGGLALMIDLVLVGILLSL